MKKRELSLQDQIELTVVGNYTKEIKRLNGLLSRCKPLVQWIVDNEDFFDGFISGPQKLLKELETELSDITMFDKDGYPKQESLDAIRKWPYTEWEELVKRLQQLWHWPKYFSIGQKYVEMHTGGWSGNESLINALGDNQMIWTLYWVSSECGGHYKFQRRGLTR